MLMDSMWVEMALGLVVVASVQVQVVESILVGIEMELLLGVSMQFELAVAPVKFAWVRSPCSKTFHPC